MSGRFQKLLIAPRAACAGRSKLAAAGFAFTLVLALLLLSNHASAGSVTSTLDQANAAYRQEDYRRAVSLYEEAINGGAKNSDNLYNLANAQYRLKELGAAVLNYRRALALDPRDLDIQTNLSLARSAIGPSIYAGTNERSVLDVFLSPAGFFGSEELKTIALIAYSAFWIFFALSTMRSSPIMRWTTNIAFAATVIFGFYCVGTRPGRIGQPVLAITPASHEIRPAVVIHQNVRVFSGDAESFQVIYILNEGTEIETGEIRSDWAQVLLPAARKGWVKSEDLGIL